MPGIRNTYVTVIGYFSLLNTLLSPKISKSWAERTYKEMNPIQEASVGGVDPPPHTHTLYTYTPRLGTPGDRKAGFKNRLQCVSVHLLAPGASVCPSVKGWMVPAPANPPGGVELKMV